MHIVTDRGLDLAQEQMAELNVHPIPLLINLDGKSYRSGEDIQPKEFYELLAATDSFPTTSQPSAGDFADLYRSLAKTDPDILSVHISSGLSGTLNSAKLGAEMVPEANVTFYDTLTLSGGGGWMLEVAARARNAGWPLDKIIALLDRVREATETMFTLDDLRYLIHGGRISHISGLIASVLQIKPIIGVNKESGMYEQRGRARTFKKSTEMLANLATKYHVPGEKVRIQIMHAFNPEGVAALREYLDKLFDVEWLPVGYIAPVLGAHTGNTMIGYACARQSVFADLPW